MTANSKTQLARLNSICSDWGKPHIKQKFDRNLRGLSVILMGKTVTNIGNKNLCGYSANLAVAIAQFAGIGAVPKSQYCYNTSYPIIYFYLFFVITNDLYFNNIKFQSGFVFGLFLNPYSNFMLIL